jgi:uncharacterized membrane protein
MQMNTATEKRLAAALGYFSIGLGLSELGAPQIDRLIGLPDHRGMMRAMGLREIANGMAIIAQPREPQWMWARAVGDAIDLGLLAGALALPRANRGRLLATIGAIVGVTLLDVLFARQLSRNGYQRVSRRILSDNRGLRLQVSMGINCSPERAYALLRDFSNLPRIVPDLGSIYEDRPGRLRWTTGGMMAKPVEHEIELIEDQPNELLSWRSEMGPIEHSGSVRFMKGPEGRGTFVRVEMLLRPSSRFASRAMLIGTRPDLQIREVLRRLKALIETGEIPTTVGQPSGRLPESAPVYEEVGKPLGLRALLSR